MLLCVLCVVAIVVDVVASTEVHSCPPSSTSQRGLQLLFPKLALYLSDLDRYSGLADDRSACVFASEVAVLLKKDRVDGGDPASFRFSFVLPAKLIPSFKARDLNSSIPRGFVGNLCGSFKVLLRAVLVVACAGVGLAAPCRHVFFLVVLPLLASDLFQVAVIV